MTFNTRDILDSLARTNITLMMREPFFAHLFAALNKEIVGDSHPVDTLAVGLGKGQAFTLYVNERFWEKSLINPAHRLGVLKHEILHLVFRHLLIDQAGHDSLLINIAFDLVVNQYIDRSELPEDSIFLESFPDLLLLPGQTWFYYYKKIQDLKNGSSGAFSGTPSAEFLQQIQADSNGLERHQPWRQMRSHSELEKTVAENHLDSLMQTAHQKTSAHAWGSLPGEIRELLGAIRLRTKPEVNWRTVLRLFVGSARSTRLHNTLKRPSKRYGATPGLKLQRKQRILIAIDTSGSIGVDDLRSFFGEIFHIWRAGAQVEVVECDTKIYNRYTYRGRTPDAVQGRGGTDFGEPLRLAARERPDALIYFTDGYALPPDMPMRVPVLWVISPKGLDPSHPTYKALPGRKTKISPNSP